ncbi:MAG: LLM class flavin-dependent oxidoreductase [Chloroflexota bacterium]
MSSPELGLLVLPERPVKQLVEMAVRAEGLGYDYVWVADEKFYRDPMVVLSAIGLATERVTIGTGVTEPYARHPALIAMAMATLEDLCPGRVVIGIGAGGPGFPPMGVQRRKPAKALAEAAAIVRGLLNGERVTYQGEVLAFKDGALNFEPRPLPIYIAARGARVLAAAGAIGDGVIMAPFASRQAVDYARGIVLGGARGSTPKIVGRIDDCLGKTSAAAREAASYFVALPLWVSYPNWGYAEALGIDLSDELRQLMARRDYRDITPAATMLPPEMIDHFAIAGTEAEAAARIKDLLPVIDQLLVHPVPSPDYDLDQTLDGVARIWKGVA